MAEAADSCGGLGASRGGSGWPRRVPPSARCLTGPLAFLLGRGRGARGPAWGATAAPSRLRLLFPRVPDEHVEGPGRARGARGGPARRHCDVPSAGAGRCVAMSRRVSSVWAGPRCFRRWPLPPRRQCGRLGTQRARAPPKALLRSAVGRDAGDVSNSPAGRKCTFTARGSLGFDTSRPVKPSAPQDRGRTRHLASVLGASWSLARPPPPSQATTGPSPVAACNLHLLLLFSESGR